MLPELNLHPSRRELLVFGGVLLGACMAAAAWEVHRGRITEARAVGALGIGLFVVALVPVAGRYAYIAWMALGLALGRLTAPVVLLVLYAILVVPLALVFRVLRRDSLQLRRRRDASSYWEDYPRQDDVASYLRQS